MYRFAVSSWRLIFGESPSGWLTLLVAVLLGLVFGKLPLLWAAGIVGGTAVFLIILIQPIVGLGLALLLGPLGAYENAIGLTSPLNSGQLLLLLTLAVWISRGLRHREIILPRTLFDIPLLVFIFVMGLTLLNAFSLPVGLKEMVKWIEILIIAWLVVDVGRQENSHSSNRIHLFLGMLLLAGISQALIGIWQFGLRGTGPEHFLVLGRFYRAYGTFEQPNPFGGFINLSALLALGALVGYGVYFWREKGAGANGLPELVNNDQKRSHHSLRIVIPLLLLGGATAVTMMALITSWSRGAWLGFGVGTAVLIIFLPRKRWQGVALLGLGMGLLLVGLQFNLIHPSIINRVTSFSQDLQFGDVRGVDINDANYAVLERLAHWQAALGMARDNLWLGVGFGNYESAYDDYDLINWPAALGHAHNYYLNLLAETGVLGLAAYLILWTAVSWQTIRLLGTLDWPNRGIALGLLGAWVSLAVHHLVDKLYVNNIYVHLGVMFGLLQLLDIETKKQEIGD